MSSIRNFCFTLNNYEEEDINNINNILKLSCNYIIFGYEIGKNGTPHLQGYAELYKKTRFESIKKMLPKAHIEPRKGTQDEALKYCQKDKNFVEIGIKKDQGNRGDLNGVRLAVEEEGLRYVARYYNLQQIRVAETHLTYNEEPRNWKPNVTWIYGESGSGKSRKAREMVEGRDIFCKNDGSKWWNGYDAHEVVILDDFRDSWFSITYFLALIDRYEFKVEYKGGFRQFKPKDIIITSIRHPKYLFEGCKNEPIKQILRRIDNIICLKNQSLKQCSLTNYLSKKLTDYDEPYMSEEDISMD